MPGVKSILIKNDEGAVVGQRFEASEGFKRSLFGSDNKPGNYVAMKRPSDGVVINANRKLAAEGYYADKGFEPVKAKEVK